MKNSSSQPWFGSVRPSKIAENQNNPIVLRGLGPKKRFRNWKVAGLGTCPQGKLSPKKTIGLSQFDLK